MYYQDNFPGKLDEKYMEVFLNKNKCLNKYSLVKIFH